MAWTNAAEVLEAWIGDDAPTDTDKVEIWIAKAERIIKSAVPGIQARIDLAEADLLENAVDVVAAMVTRKFRNPDGVRQESTTTGPFSEQRTFGGTQPGELGLTDAELELLSGLNNNRSRAYSIDTLAADYVLPGSDVWPGW